MVPGKASGMRSISVAENTIIITAIARKHHHLIRNNLCVEEGEKAVERESE
jgi:hypothetical protein